MHNKLSFFLLSLVAFASRQTCSAILIDHKASVQEREPLLFPEASNELIDEGSGHHETLPCTICHIEEALGSSTSKLAKVVRATPELEADRNNLLRLLHRHQAGEFARLLNHTGAINDIQAGPYTVFAPLNHAFERVPAEIKSYFNKHPDRLRKLLLFHIVKQRKTIDDLESGKEQLLPTLFNDYKMRIKFYDDHWSLVAGSGLVLKDRSDISFDGGLVHVLHDVILSIPFNTSAGIVAGCPNFATLERAINQAGLAGVLNQPGPFTVFAPSEAAWAQLPPGTVDQLFRNRTALKLVVMYHVTKDTWFKEGLSTGQVLNTISGRQLMVHRSADTGILRINKVGVEVADVAATNGVVHVLKGVLIPPGLEDIFPDSTSTYEEQRSYE